MKQPSSMETDKFSLYGKYLKYSTEDLQNECLRIDAKTQRIFDGYKKRKGNDQWQDLGRILFLHTAVGVILEILNKRRLAQIDN